MKVIWEKHEVNLEVLVATMHQEDYTLLERMHLETDAVVVNQCNRNGYKKFQYRGRNITWIDTIQRGLSKSRNMALSYATGDYCLIADEDVTFEKGYENLILDAFYQQKKADVISFNYIAKNKKTTRKPNMNRKAPYFRYYSSVSLAFNRIKLVKNGIHFNELIGAGSQYGAGEESLLLIDCRKCGLHVYENENVICSADFSVSTWRTGSDEKFYYDTGVFLGIGFGFFAKAMSFYYVLQSKAISELPAGVVIKKIWEGIDDFRNL